MGLLGQPVTSPVVASDGRVTFRIVAPHAQAVSLVTPDIPDYGRGVVMTKATNGTFTVLETVLTQTTNGVWEATLGPIEAGAYRYDFNVDGMWILDPLNTATSESNIRDWSLVSVPGADFVALQDVPHGAVATVTYYSKSLQRFRRMHVYTPPGYENGKGRFPVFYLLHGMGDCDDSWSTVGRAGVIMDNLIAAKKAKPMIVVMPAGHTSTTNAGPGSPSTSRFRTDEFVGDFEKDIMPYVEKHYRARTDRQNRAIAGLSMGGNQTLSITVPHLDKYAYIGVFSSGIFDIATNTSFEEKNKAALDDPKLKQGLKLFWFATGTEDRLLPSSRATVGMLRQHKFNIVFKETPGAHTWINWRDYLNEFAPQLFQ
jgi:enterochelin esterase family protein